MDIITLLQDIVEHEVNDIIFTVGKPIMFRSKGELCPHDDKILGPKDTESIIKGLLNDDQFDKYRTLIQLIERI